MIEYFNVDKLLLKNQRTCLIGMCKIFYRFTLLNFSKNVSQTEFEKFIVQKEKRKKY